MRVKVYFNLHRKVWSVQTYIKGKGWRIAFHERELVLEDVTFKVSEAGRQRVLREKRKNVHAFAIGTLVDKLPNGFDVLMDLVSYNPYKAPTFMHRGEPIHNAEYVTFGENRQVLGCTLAEKEL
jgi:hypothetical protein